MLYEPYLFSSFDSLKSSSLPSDTFRDTLPGPLIMVKKKILNLWIHSIPANNSCSVPLEGDLERNVLLVQWWLLPA